MSEDNNLSRRSLLMKLGILMNGLVAAVLAVPVVEYLLSPLLGKGRDGYKAWVTLGPVSDFPEGETRLATFQNPFARSLDGQTAGTPCWVRHVEAQKFQVFAINCAHLGCPVRWFPQSGLFMCPCHGGVYYTDGSRASGPPERGLFTYASKIESGQLMIEAGQLPTLATQAKAATSQRTPCA
jgi:menaquinol-cytochrome c reductase iron-sulfur subunit